MYRDRDGWSASDYARKIDWTQRAIRLLHPDIIGFQELWQRAALVRALEASGLAQDYDLLVPADAECLGASDSWRYRRQARARATPRVGFFDFK
jgi:hypothetical protein